MSSDLTPIGTDSADTTPFVRVLMDADGRTVIALDVLAADRLDSFLCALPLAHDLVGNGYDPDDVDIVKAIAGALGRHLRRF